MLSTVISRATIRPALRSFDRPIIQAYETYSILYAANNQTPPFRPVPSLPPSPAHRHLVSHASPSTPNLHSDPVHKATHKLPLQTRTTHTQPLRTTLAPCSSWERTRPHPTCTNNKNHPIRFHLNDKSAPFLSTYRGAQKRKRERNTVLGSHCGEPCM